MVKISVYEVPPIPGAEDQDIGRTICRVLVEEPRHEIHSNTFGDHEQHEHHAPNVSRTVAQEDQNVQNGMPKLLRSELSLPRTACNKYSRKQLLCG